MRRDAPRARRGRLPGAAARGRFLRLLLVVGLLALGTVPSTVAQSPGTLVLAGPGGDEVSVPLADHRGYAAVPSSALESLGWEVEPGSPTIVARLGDEAIVELRPGSPFFSWDGDLLQLVEAPYFFGERLYVPLQLLSGFLPRRVEDGYRYDQDRPRLEALAPRHWTPGGPGATRSSSASSTAGSSAVRSSPPTEVVVIIDPGHGGRDTGALGAGGIREKDVALGVGRALAEELKGEPGLEVHLTREEDRLVPLWERGERATDWKGDRPGIFISLHANAAGRGSSARGFETYFLSEARTDHERRVAALENSALAVEEDSADEPLARNPDLGFILTDLRNRDHQHWSALLAELVQDELAPVHPGPNRGVKQGPFAVITNALMPSVLVELGFITHGREARTLADPGFQREAARSLASAIRAFFERYPPGSEVLSGASR